MLGSSIQERLVKSFRDNERLLIICTAEFVFMMGSGVVVPVLPRFAQSFGVSTAMAGMVISVFGLARVFTNAPSGFVSQRLGRRAVLISGSLITVAASVMCAIAGDFWQLLVYRFIAGMGSGMFSTGAATYLTDISTVANRGRAMSALQGSLLVGMSVGPAVGGLVAGLLDDRATFYLIAILSMGCGLWCGLRLPETLARPKTASKGDKSGPQATAIKTASTWSILSNRNFLLIAFVAFGVFFTRTGAQFFVVPMMGYETLGVGPAEVGFALFLIAALTLAGTPFSGMAADKFGRKAAIVPGCILAGAGLMMFTVSSSYTLFLVAAIAHGFGKGMGGAAPAAYAADLAPKGMEGATMGLYRTLADIGYVLGPPALGWIKDTAGFNMAIGVATGLLIAGPILFGLFAQETLSRVKTEPKLQTSFK